MTKSKLFSFMDRHFNKAYKDLERRIRTEPIRNGNTYSEFRFGAFCFNLLLKHYTYPTLYNIRYIILFKRLLKNFYLKSIIEDPLCCFMLEFTGNTQFIRDIIIELMKDEIEFHCPYFEGRE